MRIYGAIAIIFILVSSWSGIPEPQLTSRENEVPKKTGSNLKQEDALEALDFHNEVRKEVGSAPLEWSAELATYAQEWADYLAEKNNCNIAHRSTLRKAERTLGENIFWGVGKTYSALEAAKAWYEEIEKYTYQPVRAGSNSKTGHYTQMVWKNTQKIGIGKAVCSNGATIIVANYDPPGNVIGEKPY